MLTHPGFFIYVVRRSSLEIRPVEDLLALLDGQTVPFQLFPTDHAGGIGDLLAVDLYPALFNEPTGLLLKGPGRT